MTREAHGLPFYIHGTCSGMQLRALGNLVDNFLVRPQRHADNLCIVGRKFRKHLAVGNIMTGCEHFLDIERCRDLAFQGSLMDFAQRLLIRGHDDYRLDGQGIVDVTRPVAVWFPDDLSGLGDDAGHEKCGDIQFLPHGKVITKDDGDLGIKHANSIWLWLRKKSDPSPSGYERS
ncbi:hypothetical protein AGR1B_Cc120700 [Agrobacterium fabacearum S56]|nr:hypothetical protein AGR1B_Cc120700 [Agrobacterium fabacearum S56]